MSSPNLIGLVLAVLLCGLGPPGAAFWLSRRFHLPLRMAVIAGGFYLLNLVVQQVLLLAVRSSGVASGALLALVVTPLAYAVCEEVARYCSWWAGRSMRVNRTWEGGLLAGLGHGGTESIVLVLQTVVGIVIGLTLPSALPRGFAHAELWGPNLVSYYLIGLNLGRACAVAGHLAFAQLSVMAHRRTAWFLPVAILAHFAFDAGVFALQARFGAVAAVPTLVFAGLAIVALVFAILCRPRLEERRCEAGPGLAGGS